MVRLKDLLIARGETVNPNLGNQVVCAIGETLAGQCLLLNIEEMCNSRKISIENYVVMDSGAGVLLIDERQYGLVEPYIRTWSFGEHALREAANYLWRITAPEQRLEWIADHWDDLKKTLTTDADTAVGVFCGRLFPGNRHASFIWVQHENNS